MRKRVLFGLIMVVILVAALVAAPVYGGNGRGASGDVIPNHYIVVLHGDASPQGVAEAHGVIRTQTYRHAINGFAGTIPAAKLDDVRSDPKV